MATRRTKAILTLGGIFLAGALCGALAVGLVVRGEVRTSQKLRDRAAFKEYFAEQLELTTAQRDSLQGELDWFYGELAGLRTAAAGEMHELIDSLDRRLAARLSPEQLARLRSTETRLRRQLPPGRPLPVESGVIEETPAPPADTVAVSRDPAPAKPGTPQPAIADPAPTIADTSASAAAAADPAEPMTGLRDRLKTRLGLSDEQAERVRQIVATTRSAIRTDARQHRGYPRLQLTIAARHLREMDRQIVELLDADQRARYEPIREEIARKIRAKILREKKVRRRDRSDSRERVQ